MMGGKLMKEVFLGKFVRIVVVRREMLGNGKGGDNRGMVN